MSLGNRLEKRTLQRDKDNATVVDYQNTSNNDTLYNAISIGLMALTGVGLYKTGALREIAKPMLELADKMAREGSDKAGIFMSTVKDWSKLKHLNLQQLSNSKQKYNIPEHSLFRERDTSIFYDLYRDAVEWSPDRLVNFKRVREIMDDTKRDMNILARMTEDAIENLPNKRLDYRNTDLHKRIKEMRDFNYITENAIDKSSAKLFNERAMRAFMENMTLTKEQAAQELRESGYRKLTLGDVMELYQDPDTFERGLRKKQGAKIDLTVRNNDEYLSLAQEAERFITDLNHWYRKEDGGKLKTALGHGDWENIIIDSAMRIDANGNVIDYRMTADNTVGFLHSLANDFKLPVVQFNPFKSLLGLDKIGRTKPMLGILSSNQYDYNLTKKAGQYTVGQWLGEKFGAEYANNAVAIIDGTAYTVGEKGKLINLGDGFKVHDITFADEMFTFKPTMNATRQMAGLTFGEPTKRSLHDYEEYLATKGIELNTYQKAKYKIAEMLDMGFHEATPSHESTGRESLDTATSFDEKVDNFINRMTKKIRMNGYEYDTVDEMLEQSKRFNAKSMFGEGYNVLNPENPKAVTHMYTTSKEGFKFSRALQYVSEEKTDDAVRELKGFAKQFIAGRTGDDMDEFFTERSGLPWIAMNQLSEALNSSSYLLGFSVDSKRSPLQYFKNLLLKRALPVYLATQVPDVLNYLSEPFFHKDEDGNRGNISKFVMKDIVRPIDIGAHSVMDLVGATRLFKFLGEFTPGTDNITEIPGIHFLGLGQTAEERKEYIENGVDPMRKGRLWGSGNTPLTGGKIMYWRPNIYRRVAADVDFSDSKWGSRQEYYNNTWFPNPVNPMAPLNHFIFNRHHYDKKHYQDRPYLQTAPLGSNIPIIGPAFSSTIGSVIMKPKRMHQEYWQNGLQVNPADEEIHEDFAGGEWTGEESHSILKSLTEKISKAKENYSNSLATSAYQAKQVTSRSITDSSGVQFTQKTIIPKAKGSFKEQYADVPLEVYNTPNGALSVVDIPDDKNLYQVNQDLRIWSINKIAGAKQRVDIDNFMGPDIPVGNDNETIDNAFMYGLGEQYNWAGDVLGLKGFALQTFITGEANEHKRVIEDSGYAYSINNDFWEANLGGLGGNLSEITRRFIPKRNNKTEYVNPVRNTMPTWLAGSDYFTDFLHGDPYSKIDNGEERLPGEGYERLYGIKGLLELNIGSSSIGYDKEYIKRHLLNRDGIDSAFTLETLNKGTELHKSIERKWKEAGLAFSTEGEIKDKRNGILGYYDAMVYDMNSPTGIGIVDIKTTSAKKLKEIRRTKKPLEHHQKQVNYYLWATRNEQSKGYIYYVDKENPKNNYTVGFDYSKKLLEDTFKNLYAARNEIREGVKDGRIGRGELYKPIDQYRILADVAPYSQEFKDIKAKLSTERLSEEDKKEIAEIRERTQQQKEPLRVYPYKFKTANLKSETVTVSKIIDNNTIITKEYGKEHAIKFAGIKVNESNSEYDHTWKTLHLGKDLKFHKRTTGQTKNDAARQMINRNIRRGSKIRISYDADEHNKFSNDSTQSIKAVVYANGKNINRLLLNTGHAKEKETDDSPAGIHARYSSNEIAFGSAMERITHDIVAKIPFVGSKFYPVRSPYEQYRNREVYGKDFQSWNHPIRDILIPHIDSNIANNDFGGFGGIMAGAFIGSIFGKTRFGKIVGATVGGIIPAVGKLAFIAGSDKERDWRPKRRREQEKLNEYVDVLKYVKNMKLYNQYVTKSKVEDNFDVEAFIESKESSGVYNKLKRRELNEYKKKVKLDFKHSKGYDFTYGKPKYTKLLMNKKDTISAINKEMAELQSERKVTKVPANAIKAIAYKAEADKTMYAYEPGDSLVNIMSALPKKERQYFKHFVDAPEEEKKKILRIAPSYLRRALQSTWGMKVDTKPSLQEYFEHHGLPDENWIGWDESTSIDDVKVKLVHQNKLDPGEFDIWDNNKIEADQVNIPIPVMNMNTNPRTVQVRLQQILGRAGYENIQASFTNSSFGDNTTFRASYDARGEVSDQIQNMEV